MYLRLQSISNDQLHLRNRHEKDMTLLKYLQRYGVQIF